MWEMRENVWAKRDALLKVFALTNAPKTNLEIEETPTLTGFIQEQSIDSEHHKAAETV